MEALRYISVILPLKLDWEPVFSTDDPAVETGSRVAVLFNGGRYTGVVSGCVTPTIQAERIQPILGLEADLERIGEAEITLWRSVAAYYLCSIGEVYKAAYPARKLEMEETLVRQKERLRERLARKRTQLEKARKEETRQRYTAEIRLLEAALMDSPTAETPLPDISLSPAQERAWQEIQAAFSAQKVALLQAPGRSEIFLKAATETLRRGQSVLYLVPGIALNRQLEERLYARFGARLQCSHSALGHADRKAVAAAVRSDEACLVLGTRSALFLPWRKLGLILVEEEQDFSYKQDAPAPRYNGRDTAILLGGIHRCPVLLGSATPSFESLHNARTGRFRQIVLPPDPAAPPVTVRLIDTQAERRKRGMNGVLSRQLEECLRHNFDAGHQAALILPRRARDTDPAALEATLRERFPEVSTARIDPDLPEVRIKSILRGFSRGESRLLICGQDSVRFIDGDGPPLIAVLQAERLSALQDFRADERTLQWLGQWRLRAGRAAVPGQLVIQTEQPEHPVFRILQGLDSPEGRLFEERRHFGYPPFTRLVEIQLRDYHPRRLDTLSQSLAACLPEGLSVTGPFQPAGSARDGEQLRLIRIALPRDPQLARHKEAIARSVTRFGKEHQYTGHIVINVDPA